MALINHIISFQFRIASSINLPFGTWTTANYPDCCMNKNCGQYFKGKRTIYLFSPHIVIDLYLFPLNKKDENKSNENKK